MTTTFAPDSTSAPEAPPSRSSEAGSAYLATLLVLVVLTILGLTLAVITQTEVLISGSEKQATRQLFAAGSAVEISTAYELVKRSGASRDIRFATREENIFGTVNQIDDLVCTTPYVPLHTAVCNLCAMNQDTEYAAVQFGVTTTALRRGDAALGARKTVGSVIALEPYQKQFGGFQFSTDVRLKTRDGLTMDTDSTIEVDPCEALFLKI